MPDLRATISQKQVLTLLSQYFSQPTTELQQLSGGQISRTFSFQSGDNACIVRFNQDNMLSSNLPKEQYISRLLASTSVPMPKILHVGRLEDLHYAISQKAAGQMVQELPTEQIRALFPQIIEILDAIHHVDVSDTSGYGIFNRHGTGQATSWNTFLSSIADEEDERDYFGKWHRLFEDTFLERDLFEQIYQHMLRLLAYCPSERYLVHGNYSFSNILAQDGRVTAVLDWLDALYGDFVYDLAGLDFWYSWLESPTQFLHYYQERQISLPHFQERLLCYQCHIALIALRFYAKMGNEQFYQWARQNILSRLSGTSASG